MKGNWIVRMRYLGALSAVVCGMTIAAPSVVSAQFSVGISIGTAPPPLPFYAQPVLPAPDYLWAPGYWAYGPAGYFWVPGAWVQAPQPGLLWTPGYWAADNVGFAWYPGYWGRRVGYYGGINYGFGYFGRSYVGGEWFSGHFRYNTAVTNVNTTIVRNVYVNRAVINNTTVNRVSYNGGQGGIDVRPTAQQMVMRNHAVPMTSEQLQHEHVAAQDRSQLAAVNHGQPRQLAVARPFTPQNHARFQPIRPADRVAPQPRPAPVAARQVQRRPPLSERPAARQIQR